MAEEEKNAHVPKFGNWDNGGSVPYTLYFDNARKGRGGVAGAGGKIMNPNDPLENPEAFYSSSVAPPSPPRPHPPHARHRSRPSDVPAPAPSPPLSPNPYGASPYRRGGAGRRASGGYSVDQSPSPSPLHPYSQARGEADYSEGSGGGGGHGVAASSVDRSRGRAGSRGSGTPSSGSAVPKFGDWDSNPASADGYTLIFNKVREEKQTQGGKAAGSGRVAAAHGEAGKQHDDGCVSSSGWCFGCFK